jgi:hypothetical protein
MSSAVRTSSVRSRSEESALRDLIGRLTQQFPEVAEEEIVRAVRGRYEQFDDSRVRDFVPVLVERSVRQAISAHAPRHRA